MLLEPEGSVCELSEERFQVTRANETRFGVHKPIGGAGNINKYIYLFIYLFIYLLFIYLFIYLTML